MIASEIPELHGKLSTDSAQAELNASSFLTSASAHLPDIIDTRHVSSLLSTSIRLQTVIGTAGIV